MSPITRPMSCALPRITTSGYVQSPAAGRANDHFARRPKLDRSRAAGGGMYQRRAAAAASDDDV